MLRINKLALTFCILLMGFSTNHVNASSDCSAINGSWYGLAVDDQCLWQVHAYGTLYKKKQVQISCQFETGQPYKNPNHSCVNESMNLIGTCKKGKLNLSDNMQGYVWDGGLLFHDDNKNFRLLKQS